MTLLFPATVFRVPREGHVPDELQLLPPTLRQLGDASGLTLEQGLEEVAMVGSAFVWANYDDWSWKRRDIRRGEHIST